MGFLFTVFFLMAILSWYTTTYVMSGVQKVTAFIRIKNEEKTLHACLKSIDGLFDRILIIHSNEPDDGSIAYAHQWCAQRKNCDIYEYPHAVIPANDKRYRENTYKQENSLAAYYQFGLDKISPEEWVFKIDGDELYIRNYLKERIERIKRNYPQNNNVIYSAYGYNTMVWNNRLVKHKRQPINGGMDHFAVKRKHIKSFKQGIYWENPIFNEGLKNEQASQYCWFHFKKSIKIFDEPEKLPQNHALDEVTFLTLDEQNLYRDNIVPLFDASETYSKITY